MQNTTVLGSKSCETLSRFKTARLLDCSVLANFLGIREFSLAQDVQWKVKQGLV